MSKERETANLVSSQTGVAVTISGDPIVLGVGNTELVKITGGGFVSIGVTNNPQTKLHIDGTSNSEARITISRSGFLRNNYIGLDDDADELAIAADENNEGPDSHIIFKVDGSEKLRVTGDGFVGIGSTNPGQKLTVQDNAPSGTSNIYVNNTGGDAVIYLLNNDQYSAGLGTLADNGSYIELSGKHTSANPDGNRTFGRIGAFKENNTSANGAGYLALYSRPDGSGLTEALRIDSSQRIGIGTTSPKGANDFIHIFNKNDGNAYINFEGSIPRVNRIGCSSYDNIEISADEDNEGGSSFVRIKVDGSEKARFIADGGIAFNGDSATANALDDYEEGTFTPTITNLTVGNGTLTGKYTKIGNLVWVQVYLVWGSTTSSSGEWTVNAFPFTGQSTNAHGSAHLFDASIAGYAVAATYAAISYSGWKISDGTGSGFVSNTAPFTWTTNDRFMFAGTYRID